MQTVNNLIKDLAATQGTTVFLCTHQLRYAEELCTSYGLIDNGMMFAQGTLDELRSQVFAGYKLTIKADLPPQNVKYRLVAEAIYELNVDTEAEIAQIVADIVHANGRVFHVSTARLSLEEIYFTLTNRNKGGQNNG